MRKVKVTLTAQTILQLEAGTHEAVRDGGNLYVLLQQEEGFADTQEEPSSPKKATSEAPKTTNTTAPAPQPAKEEPAVAETSDENSSENWTEEDMMNMHSDDLLAECKKLGIDPNKSDGKNTNKKLRTLILDYWVGGSNVADDTKTTQSSADEKDDDGGSGQFHAGPFRVWCDEHSN